MVNEVAVAGLRERKKLATREALARAALRLALERGFGQVRVEDIAADVGVSPRTFNNYFSSKEEAIVSIEVERLARICAAVRERPAGEPLADVLASAFTGQQFGAGRPDAESLSRLRLVLASRPLRGEYLKATVAAEGPLAQAIAERLDADPTYGLYPRVLAAALFAAARVTMSHWISAPATARLSDLLRQSIRHIVCEGETR